MNKTFPTRQKRDWKNYNNQLKQRAFLQIWLSKEVIDGWTRKDGTGDRETKERKRGHPFLDSDIAIKFLAAISQIFHLPLRQTEGFVKSLFSLASLPLPVPCFSTLCRRRRKLKFEVFRERKGKGEGMVLIVDSSGVKVMGEGEWANRQKGERRRKGWIKVHICVDYKKGQIVEFSLTDERVHDSKVFKGLIKRVEEKGLKIEELIMDGAYDRKEVWSEVERIGARAVIKVRRDGRERGLLGRDETIREVREKGMKVWAKEKGYGRRNMAEASFSRLNGR